MEEGAVVQEINKEPLSNQKRAQLLSDCAFFLEQGWKFGGKCFFFKTNQLDSDIILSREPKPAVLKPFHGNSMIDAFETVFPVSFWNLLEVFLFFLSTIIV